MKRAQRLAHAEYLERAKLLSRSLNGEQLTEAEWTRFRHLDDRAKDYDAERLTRMGYRGGGKGGVR